MSNLALNLVASAARIPERPAAITDEHAMTYAELETASARLAMQAHLKKAYSRYSASWRRANSS